MQGKDMETGGDILREKISYLKSAGIFSSLKENELEVVAEYSRYNSYRKGEILFSQGDAAEGVYVIREGRVVISRRDDGGSERDIAQFIPGESFGELDMLQNARRSATARAEHDTTVLAFPMRGMRFDDVLKRHPEISANILHKLLAIIANRIRTTNRLISEKSQWIQELKSQMQVDKLTGLYNRTFLEEELASRVGETQATALLMIKPDGFKVINDTYGHDAGDQVLRMMAGAVRSTVRENDMAVRYRGDEFSVIFPGAGEEEAVNLAGAVGSALGSMDLSPVTGGDDFAFTASMGIAVHPRDAGDAAALVKCAFDRMMEARNGGGDRIIAGRN